MTLEEFSNDWVLDAGDWDLERIEFRAKGKKPLVLHRPTLGALILKVAGYLGSPVPIVDHAVTKFLLVDTPEPATIEDVFFAKNTIFGLERLLKCKTKIATKMKR